MLLPTELAMQYFGREPATYGHSPTFVERSNVSGDYGDNQQAFWLVASQRDWSLGEQQPFLLGLRVTQSNLANAALCFKRGKSTAVDASSQATPAATGIQRLNSLHVESFKRSRPRLPIPVGLPHRLGRVGCVLQVQGMAQLMSGDAPKVKRC